MTDKNINPLRGQNDPGWNDPPQVPYNSGATSTKLKLNKRIAFPLQGPKPTAIVQPQTAIPKPPITTNPTQPAVAIVHPMPCQSSIQSTNTNTEITDSDNLPANAQEYCFESLRQHLSKNNMSVERSDDYRRKIAAMEEEWKDGKLNLAIKTSIYRIFKALEDEDFNEAMKYRKILASSHSKWSSLLIELITIL